MVMRARERRVRPAAVVLHVLVTQHAVECRFRDHVLPRSASRGANWLGEQSRRPKLVAIATTLRRSTSESLFTGTVFGPWLAAVVVGEGPSAVSASACSRGAAGA
jgi:hypothetical protein